jgi:prephenate dehydratase
MPDGTGKTIAFQGEPGAYSEIAARAIYGPEITSLACDTFKDAFQAVEKGDAEAAVIPLENSLAGSIHQSYDLLLEHQLYIIAEHVLRVSHCLIAHPSVQLDEIRRVYSHPQALAQCAHSIEESGIPQAIASHDTAGSVRLIRDQALHDAAAIASALAAEMYGMSILERDFEDEKTNYTRFAVLATRAITPEGPSKTSICFAGKNEPGLLFKCLSAFALRDIDLTKIESRPIRGVPWQYVFYLDFSGSMEDERCQRAIDHLTEMTTFVRVLGSYPRAANHRAGGEAD